MKKDRKKVVNVPNLRFAEFEGEWQEYILNNILSDKTGLGGNYDNNELKNNFPLIKMGNINRGRINIEKIEYISDPISVNENDELQYGDLLFNTRNTLELVGKVAVWRNELEKAYFNSNLLRMYFDNGIVHSNFFMNLTFNAPYTIKKLASIATGTTSVGAIYSKDLEKIQFLIPSKKEQEKITAFFELLDERISTQMKIIEKLESLIKGVARFVLCSEKSQFSKTILGSLCSIKKGQQINSSELSDKGDFYVMNGGITPSGYHTEYNSEADTISISEGGNSCGYVQYNNSKFWSGGHCYTLIDINEIITNKYLYHYLKTYEQDIMALRVGSGLPNIQKKDLEKFEVQFPSIEKQKEIVNLLDSIANKIDTEKNMLSAYKKQKTYLLSQMFI